MEPNKPQTLNVSVKSFLIAIIVILVLMVATYVLTWFIPGGEYARMVDAAGNTVIDPNGGFTTVEAGLPMFSGIWLRLLSFALIYALLVWFLTSLLLLFGLAVGYC